MKVVFLEEVEGTAHTGDVKNVAGGFARNYLLPRKLAAPATPHYIEIATQKATKEARKQSKLDEDAQRLVPQVEGKEITIEVRVGDQDKMFGSVTARDVAEKLTETTKIDLEHRQIDLKQPIREIGDHNVKVKLTRNVIANITVHVLPIGTGAEAAARAEAPTDEEPSGTKTELEDATLEADAPENAETEEPDEAEGENESVEGE
ncbi:MAG: 50S ribosomal protein L9 [Actinomycetota bacterium]|nr:50S ribosomal protein L9 [Actinomycetota bacterium]